MIEKNINTRSILKISYWIIILTLLVVTSLVSSSVSESSWLKSVGILTSAVLVFWLLVSENPPLDLKKLFNFKTAINYGERNHIQISDSIIQQDVSDELDWDNKVKATNIGVAVIEGIVTLSGQVDSLWEKNAAEKAAMRVRGVRAVAEDIVVKLVDRDERTDTEIAQLVTAALDNNDALESGSISIKVEDGWVTLSGEVQWQYQKLQAGKSVENIVGVKGFMNLIRVKPAISSRIIKSSIKQALHRSAEIEANQIDIITKGNKVIVKGWVRSWLERREVIRAAWNAPGVGEVEDQLRMGWVR